MTDDKMLVKNNAFITAKYNLTLDENRLFVWIIYNVQMGKNGLVCTLDRKDFKNIFNNKVNHSVKGIVNMLDSLKKKSIYFKEKLEDGSTDWGSYVFIMGYIYNDKSDTFRIEVPQKVYDLLMQYMDGYTPITLQTWLSLKNTNSQRFYDLLRMWSGTKNVINYTIDDIKMYLEIQDKYPQYKDFKKRVIVPAVDELNDTNMFEIDFKEKKTGRKVTSIDFLVKDKDKRKYFENNSNTTNRELIMTNQESDDENKQNQQSKYDQLGTNYDKSGTSNKKTIMYIPDESYFTKGTKNRFTKDFIHINFENEYMRNAFEDAVMITFDKDDVEEITVASYKYFKKTLDNKILEYQKEEEEDIQHKKNLEMFW